MQGTLNDLEDSHDNRQLNPDVQADIVHRMLCINYKDQSDLG